ncbi:transcription termination factor Rho [Candidatus Cyrtobacter comes]
MLEVSQASEVSEVSEDESNKKFIEPSEVAENNESIEDTTDLEVISLKNFTHKTIDQLIEQAIDLGIENSGNMLRHDLTFSALKSLAYKGHRIVADGVIDVLQEGYGFLRSIDSSYVPASDDIYVSANQIRKFALRTGDTITGHLKPPRRGERYFAMSNITEINNRDVSKSKYRVHFDDLTPLFPNKRIIMENMVDVKNSLSSRIIDIVAPLGFGQRALIVAPPRTGKTLLMQSIAHSITTNYPEAHLMVLLIDERPEEVTDMKRSVQGEVISSTFDEPASRHVQVAEMVIERAKRLVEEGKDVVILLDSITRLARAYNNVAPSSGKVLSGGVDSNALQRPKRFFGAARNIEEGGSLTIVATALVETGSKMDEVIFEEFKGTGNSEIILDRKSSEKRIYPAIDVAKSGTRREEMLIDKIDLSKTWLLRRIMSTMSGVESLEFLLDKLRVTKNNTEFYSSMDTGNSLNLKKYN